MVEWSSDRSFMGGPIELFLVRACSTTGVIKAVVCVILSVG